MLAVQDLGLRVWHLGFGGYTLGSGDSTPIKENCMDKIMHNEMETGVI